MVDSLSFLLSFSFPSPNCYSPCRLKALHSNWNEEENKMTLCLSAAGLFLSDIKRPFYSCVLVLVAILERVYAGLFICCLFGI